MRSRFGMNDYDANGKFFDPSSRGSSAAISPAPGVSIAVPAAPTTVAAAVTPPPVLPASAPAGIIDLRIAVLQAIRTYRATPTTDTLAALKLAHSNLRTAIMAHRGAMGGGGGWGGGRHRRRHHKRGYGGWGQGGGDPWSRGYGWNKSGSWGSTPPGGVVAAAAPVVAPTVTSDALKGCCGVDDYLQMGEFTRGAGMMYADDPLRGEVDNALNGTIESLFHSVGVSSNLSHWEEGVPLPQVYDKYARWIPSLIEQAKGILGGGERARLAAQGAALYKIWNPLRNAFAQGAIPGERDRSRLDELVGATRAFKKALEKAKAEWGWAPVAVKEEAPPDVFVPPSQGIVGPGGGKFPMWVLYAGAAALGGLLLFSKK